MRVLRRRPRRLARRDEPDAVRMTARLGRQELVLAGDAGLRPCLPKRVNASKKAPLHVGKKVRQGPLSPHKNAGDEVVGLAIEDRPRRLARRPHMLPQRLELPPKPPDLASHPSRRTHLNRRSPSQ